MSTDLTIKKKSFKQEIEEDLMQSFFEGFAPKLKKLLPLFVKKLKENEELISIDEIITIGRTKNNEYIILKTDKNNMDIEIKDKSKIQVHSLETLIKLMMNLDQMQ